MASKRRGGRASSKRRRAAASAKRRRDERAGIDRRGAYLSSKNKRSKPQYLTGRDAAARGIATANKQKNLQQSIGSLDRRVDKALEDGNTDLAKDLRSRQNKFVKQLGFERAKNIGGGTIQGNVRTSSGAPLLTTRGFDEFQRTVDEDFIDPTRKLQNLYPDDFAKMYPITNVLQRGPLAFQGIQAALGDKERKQIPYSLEDMPSVRYPLDDVPVRTRSDRQEAFEEGFKTEEPVFNAPVEDVLMQNIFAENDEDLILPNMAPFIDKETRNEVFAPDVDNLPANNFAELDREFQEDQARIDAENALQQSLKDEAQRQKTAQILSGSGYNLNEDVINNLFAQDFLQEGTNYFPNLRKGTSNPLIDEALASYYDSLK
jgi:hypothetical protein